MRDRLSMCGFERAGQLNCGLESQIERHRTLDFLAFDVLHDKVVGTDVVNLANVRMIQRCDGAGLAAKPLTEFFGRDFDGHNAAEARVVGFPYFAHSAGAYGGEDFVRAEFVARRKRHMYPLKCIELEANAPRLTASSSIDE